MPFTAACFNCGVSKEPANYGDLYCPRCSTLQKEGEQGFAAENPDAAQSDIIRAGKNALARAAHFANRNFTDPRNFSSTRGLMPRRPEGR